MITVQHTQECISVAYVHAVAGMAGVNYKGTATHDYGVDGVLSPVKILNKRRVESGFQIDFQLKSSTNWQENSTEIYYDIESKTYNDLVQREKRATPLILLLLCLPKDKDEWVCWNDECVVLRRMCYWAKLCGTPTSNTSTKRIAIPKHQIFTPESLVEILSLVSRGAF
jgi:hypothetical protein